MRVSFKLWGTMSLATLVASTLVVLLLAQTARAADLTFSPTDDARIAEAFPNANYALGQLFASSGTGTRDQSLLKFSVTGIGTDTVTSATLRVHTFDATVGSVGVIQANNTWNQGTVTWNTRPSEIGTSDLSAVTPSTVNGSGQYTEWDVTNAINGDGTYTFKLRGGAATDIWKGDSKESTLPEHPQLVITTKPARGRDKVAPAAPTITSGPADGSTITTGSFSYDWINAEAGGTNECSLDTGTPSYSLCTSPKSYTNVANGSYTFRVRQIDAAGNIGPAATRTVTVSLSNVTSYYVDCTGGNDANSGTAPSSAWKSLSKADALVLDSGKQLLFRRGCTWSGTIQFDGTGGFVGAYGTGDLPVIQNTSGTGYVVIVNATNVKFENIWAKAVITNVTSSCQNQPNGSTRGFFLGLNSHNITITNSKATGGWAGINITPGSYGNVITHNVIANNNAMQPNTAGGNDDAGAFGILANGDNNEIAYNQISGQEACSLEYGRDGSAVEIFGGSNNNIHHNVAKQNNIFTEVGSNNKTGRTAADNHYWYNLISSSTLKGGAILVHGATGFGPTLRTTFYNNTVYVTGSNSRGITCLMCGTTKRITAKNNIFWVTYRPINGDPGGVIEDYNDWAQKPNITLGAHSFVKNPLFVSPSTGDFHLQSTSPAIDHGTNLGFTSDLDGNPVPQGAAPDMGAYEMR